MKRHVRQLPALVIHFTCMLPTFASTMPPDSYLYTKCNKKTLTSILLSSYHKFKIVQDCCNTRLTSASFVPPPKKRENVQTTRHSRGESLGSQAPVSHHDLKRRVNLLSIGEMKEMLHSVVCRKGTKSPCRRSCTKIKRLPYLTRLGLSKTKIACHV